MYCPNCGGADIERHVIHPDQMCLVPDIKFESWSCNNCLSWFDAPVSEYQTALPMDGDQLTMGELGLEPLRHCDDCGMQYCTTRLGGRSSDCHYFIDRGE